MDLISTIKGSLLENFFPAGWNLKKIDRICALSPSKVISRLKHWGRGFQPVACSSVEDFDVMMGHEIAMQIVKAKTDKQKLAMILPVGPMGMYRWAVYFLKEWNVDCKHVWGFNMDEWSDAKGNTLPSSHEGSFCFAMNQAFYGPLGRLTVPKNQRNFATRKNLPTYKAKINALRRRGAKLVVVYGIGRVLHIAFWEPHFAAEYDSQAAWRKPTHRLGAKLHPLTIEQNAITSFKSRTTLVPAYANTIGPGLFLNADYCIGGADGKFDRGMQWQGLSFRVALQYGPDPWLPATFMPTMAGRLFYIPEMVDKLEPECN